MRWILIAIIIGISCFNYAAAQLGQELSYLRSARNIAWGQVAVAASNGVAAMHVNSASLSSFSGYGLSAGFGQTWPGTEDISAYDVGVAGAVLPGRLGVGATWSTFNRRADTWIFDQSLLRLHAGYRVSEWFDVGLEAARYSYTSQAGAEAYDFGLSARASLKDLATEGDAVSIGLQIVNLLDTQVMRSVGVFFPGLRKKTRHARLGALWSIPLGDADSSRLNPRIMLGAGANMIRVAENSSNVYPGVTVGASVLDMVTILFNYEEEYDDGVEYLPWYPLIRIGVLTDLPVGEWLGLDTGLDISLDYVFWKEQGEPALHQYIPQEAWSIAVHYTP